MSNMSTLLNVVVDKHANLLIVGKGATNYKLRQIGYETSYDDVIRHYGYSDISEAFFEAQKMGAKYIFILNLMNHYDYLELGNLIGELDFAYIVPVSIKISDIITLTKKDTHIKVSIIAFLLSYISYNKTESVIITTDKHASLYENIDSFLKDMKQAEDIFLKSCNTKINKENVLFVTNNLVNTQYANASLAGSLCAADINRYPDNKFGPTIFDIDSFDDIGNFAYFKAHNVKNTTVENLINYIEDNSAIKIHFISRIIKLIKRELEIENIIGKYFNAYHKTIIKNQLENYLNKLMNYVIYNYQINSISAYKDINKPGVIIINVDFDIWPINCLEKCHLSLGRSVH